MKAILIIEDEARPVDQLKEVIKAIDSKILIKRFSSLQEFSLWFEKAYIKPELASAPGKEEDPLVKEANRDSARIEEFALIIISHHLLAPSQYRLIDKISRYFKSKNLIGDRERIGTLFTAHETQELDLTEFARPEYDNIIFKPIDREVTKEKLLWGLSPEDASQGEGLHKEKPHDEVEMLKEIIVDRVTTLGIASVSEKEVPVGALGRYYCMTASEVLQKGFYARCYGCIPHPERPGSYRALFNFFGFSNQGAAAHRRGLNKHPKMQSSTFRAPGSNETLSVIVLDQEITTREYLENELPHQFTNVKICSYSNLVDFLLDLDPNQAATEAYADVENPETFFKPISFEYDKTGQTLLDVDYDRNEKTPLGFEPAELRRIKTLFLTQLSAEQKEGFLSYWKTDKNEIFTFKYKVDTDSRFFSIISSQLLRGDRDSTRRIVIRYALPEEIKAAQKTRGKLHPNVVALFINHKFASKRGSDIWEQIITQLQDQKLLMEGHNRPKLFVISRKTLDPHVSSKELFYFDDIFFSPFDVPYLHAKLKHLIPDLKLHGRSAGFTFVDHEMQAFSSSVARVQSISEVGLAVRYPRALELNSYRYFVIRFPEVEEQPRLLAKNVLLEESKKDDEGFLHHFVFFGLRESYNFMLRNWLMEQYTLNKQEEEKAQS